MCIYRYNMSADVGSNSKVSDSCAHGTRLKFESSTRQDIHGSRNCEWTILSGQTWASPLSQPLFFAKESSWIFSSLRDLAGNPSRIEGEFRVHFFGASPHVWNVDRFTHPPNKSIWLIWPSHNIQIDLCQPFSDPAPGHVFSLRPCARLQSAGDMFEIFFGALCSRLPPQNPREFDQVLDGSHHFFLHRRRMF